MSILECKDLVKNYGGLRAIDGIDLNLEAGQIVGLLGPNGSGKTTMIKIANGLLQPTKGEILIDGHKPGVMTKGKVAYLPDREFLPDYMSVSELLAFYNDFFGDFDLEKAGEMLKSLNISHTMRLKKMSKGTKEKIQLILTMSRDAKVYFLDEPIAGVDPAARDYILKTIITNYCPDSLVLISTHLIADVESVLDDVVFIQEGKIVLHKAADQIREEEGKNVDGLFREVFKC
ncbi:MAG: ABC transporter ATP-binding protein [Eubacteriaceae bacterium]|nr:ABC transporter ATP-binding protein [Eubacteriaceae bacterium]